MKDIKRLSVIFRTLSNVNRLKIISLLSDGKKMTVSEIATALSISFKATSNHLIMFRNADVLETLGKDGHVFYSINLSMPSDFKKILDLL